MAVLSSRKGVSFSSTQSSHEGSGAADHMDVIVVGAGVVGLAVARALALQGRNVLVLEQTDRIGTGTSSRNSQVIHAGLYYPTHSLKAQLCVRGKRLLYAYCKERGIAHAACGKLVLAAISQHKALHDLLQQALSNGVDDVQLLTAGQVHDMEPDVLSEGGALWSPSTGIVDVHALMDQMLTDGQDKGNLTLALNSKVTNAQVKTNAVNVGSYTRAGKVGEHTIRIAVDDLWLSCNLLINCAGLRAHEVASLIHRGGWQPPRQYFAKGNYFRIKNSRLSPSFQRLIYPLPERDGLGTHATLDLAGHIKFGPDVEWIDPHVSDPDSISLAPDPLRSSLIVESVCRYWPAAPDAADWTPEYSGVRPKLWHPHAASLNNCHNKVSTHDFLVAGPTLHQVPGVIHMLGIESPGLTSCLALADYVSTTSCISSIGR